jgi:pimeloyl-ACP methyl ester carboxylesterase
MAGPSYGGLTLKRVVVPRTFACRGWAPCAVSRGNDLVTDLRSYGEAPFDVAVVHGGPGAGGEMAPVALELAREWGVLEPLQTATSLEGQVEELRTVLDEDGDLPVTLIGFSWGAWLSFIMAARYPALVRKLILVGSGPYQHEYVGRIQEVRLSRLSEAERAEYNAIIEMLDGPTAEGKPAAFARLGALASKTDTYDPIVGALDQTGSARGQGNVFHEVLREAMEMRRSGELLALGGLIRCPVVAIHGDYDPHPVEGVQGPLSAILVSFRLILLEKCGHKPWIERHARESFYRVLQEELRQRMG